MKPLLIQIDDQTLAALKRVAPGRRQRSEFVRQAIRQGILRGEYSAMRDAYLEQPDSPLDADEWSAPEEFMA